MTTSKGGPPLLWEDPKVFEQAIDDYFIQCDETILHKQVVQKGEIIQVPTPTPYTMAGLARALRCSRDTLNQYSHNDKFADVVSHARMKVHEQNIVLALIGVHDSKIAALNLASNFGYVVKTDIGELADTVSGILKHIHVSKKAHKIGKRKIKQLPQSSTQSKPIDAVPIPGHDTDWDK